MERGMRPVAVNDNCWSVVASVGFAFALVRGIGEIVPLSSGVALGGALSLAGLYCVGLGLWTRRQPPYWTREPESGRDLYVRPVCRVLWIPAEFWGLLYLGLAALLVWTEPNR